MHSLEPADASRPSAGRFSPAAFHGVFIMTIDKAGCAAIEASIRNLADNVPNSPTAMLAIGPDFLPPSPSFLLRWPP